MLTVNTFKVRLSPSKKIVFFASIKALKKMREIIFYFILKALFILKIFKFFVLTFWSCMKNGLIKKIMI